MQPEVCGKHLPIPSLAAHFEGAFLSHAEAQTDGQSSCGRCVNLVCQKQNLTSGQLKISVIWLQYCIYWNSLHCYSMQDDSSKSSRRSWKAPDTAQHIPAQETNLKLQRLWKLKQDPVTFGILNTGKSMPQCRNTDTCMETAEFLHLPFPVHVLTL